MEGGMIFVGSKSAADEDVEEIGCNYGGWGTTVIDIYSHLPRGLLR